VARVTHAGVLCMSSGAGLRRVRTVLEFRCMRVIVRGDGRVGQRHRAAVAAALTHEPGQLVHRGRAGACRDVHHAMCGVHMDLQDVRVLAQTLLDECRACLAAPTADRHAQRGDGVVGMVVDVGGARGGCMCHGSDRGSARRMLRR
jgi:hypothetical protein